MGSNSTYVQDCKERPGPNVELHVKRTKLSELSSWLVRRLTQLSSSDWIKIDQQVLSVCFSRIERVKIDCGRNVDLSFHETDLTKNSLHLHDNVFLASKYSFLLLWIWDGRFDVWPNGRALPVWVDQTCNLVRLMWSSTFGLDLTNKW